MIERFYLKDYLSFKEIDLEFDKNLIIFSGPSGAGKSILMEALLTIFGLKDCDAKVIEATINKKLNLQNFGIDEDETNIFRYTKDKSSRYFINGSQISKKNVKLISTSHINYLTLREFREFENERLLELLDAIILKSDTKYQKTLDDFRKNFDKLQTFSKELKQIIEDEKKITDLKEFTKFEIEKIEKIDPRVGEYEELMIQKKELSRKEKIETSISEASQIFELESKVNDALTLLDVDSGNFDESFNELRVIFESASQRLSELDNLDIEDMLLRLENLSSLKTKYGSIEESLEHLAKKKTELLKYENIEFQKSELEKKVQKLQDEVDKLTTIMSDKRTSSLKTLSQRVEHYLNLLYLQSLTFTQNKIELHENGVDEITVSLKNTNLNKISSGELNRVRLAQLCASSEFIQDDGGVLILDEIDANLSGKESMSIAKVLQLLSQSYQIFAISHQPQLTSYAHMHFLVHKENDESQVTELKTKDDRINELSRMISGDEITKEAIEFANSLLV
jgi:DNA repair protein RecN (Recombination protein N)